MNVTLKGGFARVASVTIGLAMLVALATPVGAQTVESLLAQIQQLQAQLLAMQSGTSTTSCNFTTNLSMGMSSSAVTDLQKYLNSHGAQVSGSGAGAPGSETMYFGSLTKAAVMKWQNMNASSVLTPIGLTSGTGFWGPSSRAFANSLCTTGPISTLPSTATGGSAMITAGTQPANGLAPESAARVPFTKFTVTAGVAAVTLNSVEVERTGLMDDDTIDSVVLLDGNGVQIGISKTLNSNHRTTVGEPVIIPAGSSMTFTVGANMVADNSTNAGQVGSLSVVGLNTTGTVSGSFPITGASHTINSTLDIGSVSINTSGLVNTSATIDIGEADTVHAGIRLTAGSAENIRIWSIRWNNAGSAAPSDLANVVVKVDGASYPTVVSADGKYYTATFGGGILVAKGNTAEIIITATPLGGPARTIRFDLYKRVDVAITGELFGYGITPPAGSGTAAATTQEFTAGTPWYDGITKTIQAGTLTTISKSNAVPAQNIAENVSDQPLGAFEADIKGEPISVQSSVFQFEINGAAGGDTADIDNVSLVNLTTGQTVAGPKDVTASATAATGTITFTDTITYPVGKNTYVLRGKLGTDFNENQTIIASTTPSIGWTSVTGQTTGNTITLTNGVVVMNTMTVKVATATVAVNSSISSQNVVVGTTNLTTVKLDLDATASGEDVRLNSFEITMDTPTETGGDSVPTNCFAYSAVGTRLNSSAVNPTEAEQTFTLTTALILKKGTIETISIKCDVPSGLTADNSFRWTLTGGTNVWTGVGATSGQSVTVGVKANGNGATWTLKSAGTFTVVRDASSPSYAVVRAGQNNVTVGVLKFTGTNEEMDLTRLGVQLTNTASSSNATVIGVSLWDGANKVGSGLFSGSATTMTINLNSLPGEAKFTIPKDGTKLMTIKADIANIGVSESGVQGALVAIDYDGGSADNETLGKESGTTIEDSSATDTAVEGIRIFKSVPTFARLAVPSSVLVSGTTMDLYRFSVSAAPSTGNGIGVFKFTINVATSSSPLSASTTLTNLKLMAYTDSGFSSPVSGFSPPGQLNDTIANFGSSTNLLLTAATGNEDVLQIPAGATYYFAVKAEVTLTGAITAGTIVTFIEGDDAYPIFPDLMSTTTRTDETPQPNARDNFIWSPNATTTSASTTPDWTNGYLIPGLPTAGLDATTISK